MIQFTPGRELPLAWANNGAAGNALASGLRPSAAGGDFESSCCDQGKLLRWLGGNLRCADEHAGMGLAGSAGTPPYSAALEFNRHRELGDFADRAGHRFVLSPRRLGSGCFRRLPLL